MRSVAAAVGRLKSADPAAIRQLALSGELPLDGFKGRKLSYRDWNGQLRQPIPWCTRVRWSPPRPQDGFLHPLTDLDSLGFDRPESRCNLAADGGWSQPDHTLRLRPCRVRRAHP